MKLLFLLALLVSSSMYSENRIVEIEIKDQPNMILKVVYDGQNNKLTLTLSNKVPKKDMTWAQFLGVTKSVYDIIEESMSFTGSSRMRETNRKIHMTIELNNLYNRFWSAFDAHAVNQESLNSIANNFIDKISGQKDKGINGAEIEKIAEESYEQTQKSFNSICKNLSKSAYAFTLLKSALR